MRSMLRFLLVFVCLFNFSFAFAQTPDEDLQAMLESYVAADDPGMVALVDFGDGEIYYGAAGLADLDAQTPVTVTDHFRIASITKMFVATVTVQLAQDGLLNLDDPMAQWLPDIAPNFENGDVITIRQLLNMTSGIFNYTESDAYYESVDADPVYPWTAAETITYAYEEVPYFAPGEGWYYSNTNYNLLHLIIEAATGKALAEVLKERIFDPVGMTSTYLENPASESNIVHGYSDWDGDGLLDDVTMINDGLGLGDGGIITIASDLALFPRALFNGELLSEASLDEMLTFITSDEGDYGLGIARYDTEYGELFGHDGATGGFLSSLNYIPESDTVVVVWTNNFDSELLEDVVLASFEAMEEE